MAFLARKENVNSNRNSGITNKNSGEKVVAKAFSHSAFAGSYDITYASIKTAYTN